MPEQRKLSLSDCYSRRLHVVTQPHILPCCLYYYSLLQLSFMEYCLVFKGTSVNTAIGVGQLVWVVSDHSW